MLWKLLEWLTRLLAWPPPIRVNKRDRTRPRADSVQKPQVAFVTPEPAGAWTLIRLAATF